MDGHGDNFLFLQALPLEQTAFNGVLERICVDVNDSTGMDITIEQNSQ
jgi:hypothetical protein